MPTVKATEVKNSPQQPQKVLLITSFYPEAREYMQKKVAILADIIRSRWDVSITQLAANDYTFGKIQQYDSIFFLNEQDEDIPQQLRSDLVYATRKHIVLMGYPAGPVGTIVNQRLTTKEIPVTWSDYKGVIFPEEGLKITFNGFEATSTAMPKLLIHSLTGDEKIEREYPLSFNITNSQLVGEKQKSIFTIFPFPVPSYYQVNNHTLIFLDLLHEVLGDNHKGLQKPTALLRLEDINVKTYYNPDSLQQVYSFLRKERVPFHLAMIPRYVDPKNNIDMRLNEGRRFFHLLQEMVKKNDAVLVQHGYTHQVGSSVSGVGFEFWDEGKNAPLSFDSTEYYQDRVAKAREAMKAVGLPVPDIWETPHYALSELGEKTINSLYSIRYERTKNIGSLPFVAVIDGVTYIPENLGFISDNPGQFVSAYTVEDIETQLQYLSVFRNSVASFFWHPWRNIAEIQRLIPLLKSKGYTFIHAYDAFPEKYTQNVLGATDIFVNKKDISYVVTNAFIICTYGIFIAGCIFYARTMLRLKRYMKIINTFSMPLHNLQKIMTSYRKTLPQFVIFVPARNESEVIGNTIRRLASLDYPKSAYKIIIITDEREKLDKVTILTKTIVAKVGKEINARCRTKLVECIEIPDWYSGKFGDYTKAHSSSTKGRALNYGLQTIQKRRYWKHIDMIGLLDADGRMHIDVLKEVAYNRITKGSKILQGPVFQFSNFPSVSITGVAAGIELAIHHLTELPSNLLREGRVQFLAGTNYFIDAQIIREVGGWNQKSLAEDAELALRIYIKKRACAEWIGSPEIEQTPSTFHIYKRQRRRWVRGHLDLIRIVREANIPFKDKTRFYWKIFVSQFRFILDIGFPIIGIFLMISGLLSDLGPWVSVLSIVLLLFAALMWDVYGYVYRKLFMYIDKEMNRKQKLKMSARLFVFTPLLLFIQSIPRLLALADYILSKPNYWYKTERTKEYAPAPLVIE